MGFYGLEFIFDGISSRSFDVVMIGGEKSPSSSVSMNYETYKIGTGERIILGGECSSVITFPITIARQEGLDRYTISKIINWLTDRKDYKKLQIVQDGMEDLYYKCYMNNPVILESGNKPYGISFEVTCDAPWAYENTKTKILDFTSYSNDIRFENYSDSNDDLVPIKVMVRALNDGAIRIVNKTYGDRVTEIVGCTAHEVITMNERLGLVETSKQIRMLERFNKKFLRMLPNVNELRLENIQQIVIEYQFIRKIGG